MDPEDNKIELRQPNDIIFAKHITEKMIQYSDAEDVKPSYLYSLQNPCKVFSVHEFEFQKAPK